MVALSLSKSRKMHSRPSYVSTLLSVPTSSGEVKFKDVRTDCAIEKSNCATTETLRQSVLRSSFIIRIRNVEKEEMQLMHTRSALLY